MASTEIIPKHWAQHTVENSVNVLVDIFWTFPMELNLEETGSAGDYKDLPKITKTTPVSGDFSQEGHSRRVHFENGKTLLESIILLNEAREFAYELTEIEIDLKRAAKRARGHFRYHSLPDGKTKVVWTYGFHQKNFFVKWLLNRYIKSTHRFWMEDTLAEIKKQSKNLTIEQVQ